MQLQAMERMDTQEKELQRLSALLVEHQAVLKSFPERPHQETTPTQCKHLCQFRYEAVGYLPGTVYINRGVASETGQVPVLNGLPTIKRDTFKDILTDAEVPVTQQRWIWFSNMATLMPIVLGRPTDYHEEWTPWIGVSWVPSFEQGPEIHMGPQKDLFEEGFGHSLQATATEF